MLAELSKNAAAAHCPFIAGASPTVMQMDTWQELANPRDLTKIFLNTEYAAWRSLRESDDSRYLGLAMPRFLARLPYGAKTSPVDEFDFEEDTGSADHRKYTLGQFRLRDGRQHQPLVQVSTAGARRSAASSPAASSRICRSTRSPPTTAAST